MVLKLGTWLLRQEEGGDVSEILAAAISAGYTVTWQSWNHVHQSCLSGKVKPPIRQQL